jgi:hypothetical protein
MKRSAGLLFVGLKVRISQNAAPSANRTCHMSGFRPIELEKMIGVETNTRQLRTPRDLHGTRAETTE